jgi:predicted nucleotidyltransferase
MINVEKKHLALIKDVLSKYVSDCEVRIFGSRLTDKAKSYSDLDLVVIGKEKIKRQTLIRLKEEFEASDLPFRIDLLDWHRISEAFHKIIQKQYVVLQEPKV